MFTSLSGRSVIVTGGGRGIGRGIARRFGAVGCKVLVVALEEAEAAAVAESITAAGGTALAFAAAVAESITAAGGTALPFAADVSDPAACDAMATACCNTFGGIDILCANAGIFPAAKLGTMTAADFDRVIATNLKGTFLSVSACLPIMKAQRRGRIVVTSSITGPITGYPGWAHYGASKAGQMGFVRTAAIELAPFGITINAVQPGNIMTEGLEGLGADYLAKMTASIPQRRLGTPDDIANAALFFATDEAAFITGQVLPESMMALDEMDNG